MMSSKAAVLWSSLLVWQAIRCGLLLGLIASPWQSWLLIGVVLLFFLDLFVLKRLHLVLGIETADGAIATPSRRDPGNLAFLGYIAYLCAAPLAASVPFLQGSDVQLAEGRRVGLVTIAAALQDPGAGVIEFSEGSPRRALLGAVEYKLTARTKKFFYALPFVTETWSADEPVSVWAIVDEGDLRDRSLPTWRVGLVIHESSLHSAAYQKAIDHACRRGSLTSAKPSLVVRLAPATGGSAAFSETGVIAAIFFITWLAAGPYTIRASRVENPIDDAPAATSPAETSPQIMVTGWLDKRRTWLGIHLGLYVVLAILSHWDYPLWLVVVGSILALIVLPLSEGWLIFRAYRDMRQSGRVALLLAMLPLSMLGGVIFVLVSGFTASDSRGLATRTRVSLPDAVAARESPYIEIPGAVVTRGDLSGEYYAPTETTEWWWVTPVVSETWTKSTPVTVWLKSIDRTRESDLQSGLRYARVARTPDARIDLAVEDALSRHGLTSGNDALVIERLSDPEKIAGEALGLLIFGGLVCFLAWALCACFWPRRVSRPPFQVEGSDPKK